MVNERTIDLGIPGLLPIKLPIDAAHALKAWRDRYENVEQRRDELLARSVYLERLLKQRNRQLLQARRRIATLEAPRKGWEQHAKASGLPVRSEPPYSDVANSARE